MKKNVLLFLVALFFATAANAQADVTVGPKLGYQASKLSFKKEDVKGSLDNDMNFGIFVRFNFRNFVLQPELLYSYQNSSQKLNNLSLPVLFGYKLVDGKNFMMRANAGPVAYFTVGDHKPTRRKLNMGGAVGLGVDIWRFTLDINYSLGLTNVFGDMVGSAKAKQNIFTTTLGFKLRY